MSDLLCKRCGLVQSVDEADISVQTMRNGNKHLRANCGSCGRWIKYLPQSMCPENLKEQLEVTVRGNNPFWCTRCHISQTLAEVNLSVQVTRTGMKQLRANCGRCGNWIKYLDKRHCPEHLKKDLFDTSTQVTSPYSGGFKTLADDLKQDNISDDDNAPWEENNTPTTLADDLTEGSNLDSLFGMDCEHDYIEAKKTKREDSLETDCPFD
jgi:hypothetical protein